MSIIKRFKHNLPYTYEYFAQLYYCYLYNRNKKMCQESPEKLVKYVYKKMMRRELNLIEPKTFNEKLNWMKLYWYDERAIVCSDKYLVRGYLEEKKLDFLLNDLYGVYDNPDDIDPMLLPQRCVLKTTHDSGMHIVFCEDKKQMDWKLEKLRMKRWLGIDYCYMSGEWPYHTKHPRIICEKYLEDKKNGELLDYKFFCFNGKPEIIFFASNRKIEVKSDFYDLNWNLLPFRWYYEPSGMIAPKPKCLDKMIDYAKILSEGFPFVRVDFYEIDGQVVFGELTFFHGGGCGWFKPESADYDLGSRIELHSQQYPWKKIL